MRRIGSRIALGMAAIAVMTPGNASNSAAMLPNAQPAPEPAQANVSALLQYSDWDTIYDAPGGLRVAAKLSIRNGSGYYINQFGTRGELRNIRAYEAFPHNQVEAMNAAAAPTPALYGTFELGGTTGFFVFRIPDANGNMDGYSGSYVRQNGQQRLRMGGSWDGRLIGVGETRMPQLISLPALAVSDWNSMYVASGGRTIRAKVYIRGVNGYFVPDIAGTRAIGYLTDVEYHERFDHGRVENLDQSRGRWSSAITGRFNLADTTGFFVFRLPDATGRMDGYWGQWEVRDGQLIRYFRGSWDGQLDSIGKPADGQVIRQEIVEPAEVGRAERQAQAKIEKVARVNAAVRGVNGTLDELPEGWVRLEAGIGGSAGSVPPLFRHNLDLNVTRVGRIVASKQIRLRLQDGREEEIPQGRGFGTGFLVSDSLLLTCNHVIKDDEIASKTEVHFGRGDFKLIALEEKIELASPTEDLDFSLIRLRGDAGASKPGASLGYYSLTQSDLPNPDGSLFGRSLAIGIIHFPSGVTIADYSPYGMYYLQRRNSDVPGQAASLNRYIGYDAATDKGSSGAPVYDSSFRVIALHRGKLGRFEHGVRIDRIIESIRRKRPDLLDELRLRRQP